VVSEVIFTWGLLLELRVARADVVGHGGPATRRQGTPHRPEQRNPFTGLRGMFASTVRGAC
jgi:hypothetical protein